MRRTLAVFAAVLSLATAAHAQTQPPPGCFRFEDLQWAPAIARNLAIIDTTHRGCVYGHEIVLYRAALAADRREQAARIRTRLAGEHPQH